MLSQFGIEASRPALYVIAFAIILALVALFGLVLRKLTGGRLMVNGQDRSRARQPRLGVVDIYDLDRQRQLVLLRRDNVEHLLLIGGLNDVVIETNIVRVAGARIPAGSIEPGVERFEPTVEPIRPQVETPGRPSIETQLAAQLGNLMKRAPEDAGENGAPGIAAEQARAEPASDRPEAAAYGSGPSVSGHRSDPEPVAAPSPAPRPPFAVPHLREAPPVRVEAQPVRVEAPPVRAETRPSYMPPVFQSRPTPQPPAPPPPAPPVSPVAPVAPVRTTEDAQKERSGPAAGAALSDMAKQLEEALKRPATPVAPGDDRAELASTAIEDNPDIEDDDLLEPATPAGGSDVGTPVILSDEVVAAEETVVAVDGRQPESPERPQAEPAAGREDPNSPASPKAPEKVSDPFSVEEIEAEFARLLGRPLDTGKKG